MGHAFSPARTIRQVMRPEPVCVTPDTSIRALLRTLEEEEISGVPVVGSDGRLVGVVSRTDLLRRYAEAILDERTPSQFERLVEGPEGALPEEGEEVDLDGIEEALGGPEATVEACMTPEPMTAHADDPVAPVARRMAEAGIHRVIVTDAAQVPIGIVTSIDLLRHYPGA